MNKSNKQKAKYLNRNILKYQKSKNNKILSLFFFSLLYFNLFSQENNIKVGDELNLNKYELIPITEEIDQTKIKVIEFWATWCGPCIASFPNLENIQEEFKDHIQIISISEEPKQKVVSFVKNKNFKLDFFVDASKRLFKRFDILSLPLTAIVSKNNKLIWVGKSYKLKEVLNQYLSKNHISKNIKNITHSKYYSEASNKSPKINNQFEYSINLGKESDPYMVKNQKNKEHTVNIKYLGVTVTEILTDLLDISSLRIINNRKDLNNTIVNVIAKSNTDNITYGMSIGFIIKDLKKLFKFQISTKKEATDIYELKVLDIKKLSLYKNDIPGGGFARTKDGQLTMTRLKVSELSFLLERKLEKVIVSNEKLEEKYDLKLNLSDNIIDLNKQLKIYGLVIHPIKKEIVYTIIN